MQTMNLYLCFLFFFFILFISHIDFTQVNCAKPLTTPANDPQIINRINLNPRGTWKAKSYKKFEGKTIGELRKMLGLIIDDSMMKFYLNGPPKGLVESSLKVAYGKVSNKKEMKKSVKKKVSNKREKKGNNVVGSGKKRKETSRGGNNGNNSAARRVSNKRSVSSSTRRRTSSTSTKRNTSTTRRTASTTTKRNTKRPKTNVGGATTLDTTTQPTQPTNAVVATTTETVEIPKSFDIREKWPNCVLPIRNQILCGSCWAFTTTGVLAHRLCVASNGKIFQHYSPEYLVRCSLDNMKCVGGFTPKAWKFVEDFGVPTERCVKYTLGRVTDNSEVPGCPTTCDDGTPLQFQKSVQNTYRRVLFGDDKIKQSIMTEGSIHGQMVVFRDFVQYKGGIYRKDSDTQVGGHAIQIVGWGVDAATGIEYWTCLNSWGEKWGEKGYFRIEKGQVGIGNFVFAPQVEVPQ